jgi:hypothetical protein
MASRTAFGSGRSSIALTQPLRFVYMGFEGGHGVVPAVSWKAAVLQTNVIRSVVKNSRLGEL